MSFKGVGGSKRLGIAIAASVVVHIVAFGLFVSIGGGGGNDKSSEPPPLPPPPPELEQPAAIADSVEPAGRGEKTAPADPVVDEAPKAKSKPKAAEAKPPEAKKPEARKPEAKKPEAKKPETKKPEAAKPAEEADAGADSGEWKLYEVRPGDSLTKIAKKCGVTVQELAKANGLKPTANLNLGQKIKIKASE